MASGNLRRTDGVRPGATSEIVTHSGRWSSRRGEVFHLAAQVAVTTSLLDPIDDFERNALGTLNLLEELRRLDSPPPLVFTSTNKVYGGLEDIALTSDALEGRYEPDDAGVTRAGESVRRAHSTSTAPTVARKARRTST